MHQKRCSPPQIHGNEGLNGFAVRSIDQHRSNDTCLYRSKLHRDTVVSSTLPPFQPVESNVQQLCPIPNVETQVIGETIWYRNLCITPFCSTDTLSKSVNACLFFCVRPSDIFLFSRLQPLGQVFRAYSVDRAAVGSSPCFVKHRGSCVFSRFP